MPTLSAEDPVEAWIQGMFGLTLGNFPAARGAQLRALLEQHPRASWDELSRAAVGILSIPETHFQRHPECFDALAYRLRQIRAERPTGPIRLWSAGCASGEEAYNLAAVGLDVVGDRVEVFATDFSPAAISKAREGRYGSWSLRGHDLSEMSWLTADQRGGCHVVDEVRSLVSFEVGGLTDPGPPFDIDVAFCRNVLIYFSDEGGGRVLDRVARALRPDGLLILAPTDPSPRGLRAWSAVSLDAPRPVRAYRPPPGRSTPAPPREEIDVAQAIRNLLRKS